MSLKYTVEEVVSSWRQTARIASITSGRLNFQNKNVINISAIASQQNLAKEDGIKFQTHFTIQKSQLALLSQSDPIDISSEKLKAFGTSTNLVAILREILDTKACDKNKPHQILEIWKNGYLHSSLDVGLLEKHGKVYTDGTFGCFQLSPDEKQLVYIAEKKDSKKQSYLQFGIASTSEGTKVGAEYDFVEDWGEQLVGKSQPVICIFNVDWEPFTSQDSAVKILELSDLKEIWSPGQMIWCSNVQLAGVALYHDSRRLGRIFCTNRSSRLFKVDTVSGEYEWFGSKEETANCPRYNSKDGSIVYLKSAAFGPHHKEQKIVLVGSNGALRQVDFPMGLAYQGMYNDSLPDRCWSKDGRALFFSTPCKSSIRSYILNLDLNNIHQLSLPDGCSGSVVLDVLEDFVLVVGVSLLCPDQLFLGQVDWTNLKSPIEWKRFTSGNELPSRHSLSSDLLTFKTPDAMEFEAMLIHRKDFSAKTPLVVSPHGGPHSVFTDQFKLESYFLTQLGFAVLYVNYRGTTGFGEEALNSLLGNVGVQDVQECHRATLEALKKYTFLDKDSVFLWGGSHGGFLVTHLSGQFPDLYKGVSTRNPVTNLATMYTISDIPDWCIVESGLGNGSELEKILNPETLKHMFNCSPIKYVEDVKAPTLLLVGKVDRRVPPTQSIEYYHALLLHGKKAKMLVYEDNHSISQLPFYTDALVNTVLWFQESVK